MVLQTQEVMIMSASLSVWAVSGSGPGLVSEDACASDPSHGQPGWDVGVNFGGIGDLVLKLQELQRDKTTPWWQSMWSTPTQECLVDALLMKKLAIVAHGYAGEFYINGPSALPLSAANFATFLPQLRAIGETLEPNATIYLMGCLAGQGSLGADLLNALSREWRGRTVVAFIRVGTVPEAGRCPGQKFGDAVVAAGSQSEADHREAALIPVPWASEFSPQAKVSHLGALTKDPDPTNPEFGIDFLTGTWDVEIGNKDWTGSFVFQGSGSGSVYWVSMQSRSHHVGTWNSSGGRITWDFKKDDPTDIRTFELSMPLRVEVHGNISPAGQGWFKMTKAS
jgi:hypothetical protein